MHLTHFNVCASLESSTSMVSRDWLDQHTRSYSLLHEDRNNAILLHSCKNDNRQSMCHLGPEVHFEVWSQPWELRHSMTSKCQQERIWSNDKLCQVETYLLTWWFLVWWSINSKVEKNVLAFNNFAWCLVQPSYVCMHSQYSLSAIVKDW